MGKSKKSKISDSLKPTRNESLVEHILEDKTVRAPGRTKTRDRNDADDEYVDDRLSRKILEQARKQQEELEEEHGVKSGPSATHRNIRLGNDPTCPDYQSESEDEEVTGNDEYYEDIEICEEDEKALERFMSEKPPARRTLADIIMEKITEKKTELQSQMTDQDAGVQIKELDERIVKMYRSIKDILKSYRSGKLPKAFKIIPSLSNWEQILYLTEPETWSAAALYQATRLFSSNLNAHMAQRFYNLVLLPRIRDDIQEFKRLNFHLYQAMRKSLYKPAGFFKGILLPLCESGTCTLREATIISSVLAKCSIPLLHSAAGMLKIAEMDYNGGSSVFLRTLLDKKYALPYRVVDALVFHFLRMQQEKRELPVLWHLSLLTFAQRYKNDLASEQRDALLKLLRVQTHHSITPEIRRELVHAKCRDLELEAPGVEPME